MKKIIISIFICLLLISCNRYEVTDSSYDNQKKINIIFGPKDSKNLSDIKEKCFKETPNVTTLGCGNIVGSSNLFDYSAIGEEEFYDNLDSFYANTIDAKTKYLACNLSYSGQTKDVFKNVLPYVIVDYDGIEVAYIGVTTPELRTMPIINKWFMENDNTVVNFYDEEAEVFYDTIQQSINNVKEKGAKYVILLCYLEDDAVNTSYSAYGIIKNLYDVDVIIDGNRWSMLPMDKQTVKDINNNDVIFTWFNKEHTGYGLITIEKENISIEIDN